MNQPDRYDRFVVPQGIQKVSYVPDTKIAHSATIEIQREDHTVGNLVRMQLHEDDAIWFAGYKVPHPLEHRMLVKVRTNGKDTPGVAYNRALDTLRTELSTILQDFKAQVTDQMKDGADFEPHLRLQAGGAHHMDGDHPAGPDGDYGVQYGEDPYGAPYGGGEAAYGAPGFADMDTDTGFGAPPGAGAPYGAATDSDFGVSMGYGPAT